MRRGKAPYALIVVLVLCTCSRSDQGVGVDPERDLVSKYGFIGLPDKRRVVVRYSTIDEVLQSLGEPTEQQHFAKPGEDFIWYDFTIYAYNDGNLKFYFEEKGRRIIRIDATVSKLQRFSFPAKLAGVSSVDAAIAALRRSPGITKVDKYGDGLVYSFASLPGFMGIISYRSPVLYTMYFSAPWKGYEQ
jgi:hypothetical protein